MYISLHTARFWFGLLKKSHLAKLCLVCIVTSVFSLLTWLVCYCAALTLIHRWWKGFMSFLWYHEQHRTAGHWQRVYGPRVPRAGWDGV